MRKSKKYQRTLQEILDSDDEITTDYVESSYIPSYQDDTRFEYFKELKKREALLKNEIETEIQKHKIIKNGILSKKDINCLQCIQRISTDTLVWFFEFLIYKDLQSNYKFLKSCLVPKYECSYSKVHCGAVSMCKSETKYKIVINK